MKILNLFFVLIFASIACALMIRTALTQNLATGSSWDIHWAPTSPPSGKSIDLQLQQACASGDVKKTTALLDAGAGIESKDVHDLSPLILAVANNHPEILHLLLDKGAKVDAPSNHSTPLEFAAIFGRHDMALTLVDHGANCQGLGFADEQTPLDGAARQGDVSLLQALLDHGAGINYQNHQGTALGFAVMNYQLDAVQFLLAHGADPNMADTAPYDGFTPLLDVTRFNGDPAAKLSVIKMLLAAKADPNIRCRALSTALMFAANHDWPEIMQALLDAGADVNVAAYNGSETALTIAGDRGLQDIVDLLKAHGATKTDMHIIEHYRPNPAPGPVHSWALALGAIYDQINGWNPYILGAWGDDGEGQLDARIRGRLSQDWQINDAQGLRDKLDYLRTTGERAAVTAQGAKLAALTDDQFNSLLKTSDPQQTAGLQATRAGYLKWKDKLGLGFDLCSSADLINSGVSAGYLTEPEAWDRLFTLARLAQANFNSWDELGKNFLDSQEVISGKRDPNFELVVQLLSNSNDPYSPWNLCPWKTPIEP